MHRSSPSFAEKWLARLLVTLLLIPPVPGTAEIAGERVISGDASFHHSGDITTIHASDGAIIHYDALNVWANEELHFVQPDAQSRVLNQVFGDATHIDGGLYANGIVYILNPAGIFFGGDAIVEVGGLIAAAGHLNHDDFLAGRDRFELTGPVENFGQIEATSVALLGARVANHGSIQAPDGTIALVAGERVLLTTLGGHLHVEVEGVADDSQGAAIQQAGQIDAGAEGDVRFTTGDVYSLALNHEGITRGRRIELRADSGTVRVAGQLDASASAVGQRGGRIAVTGQRVSLEAAQLYASGEAGGGEILVGGDLRGRGELPNARRTAVDAESRLRADALGQGDGGKVIVWADEATAFLGGIRARGGAAGGDGGFAEVSGAVFLWSEGQVDLGATQGESGTLLYDPRDIELVSLPADGDDPGVDVNSLDPDTGLLGQVLFGDAPDTAFQVSQSELENTDADILLEATNRIFSSETLDIALLADRSLTLTTSNADDTTGDAGIALGTVSFTTSGSGAISFATGTADAGVDAPIAVENLTTGGSDLTLATAKGSISVMGAILTAGADSAEGLGASGGAGGNVELKTADGAIGVAGDIDSSGGTGDTAGGAGGSILLAAADADASGGDGVTATGVLNAAGGAGRMGAGGAGGSVNVTTAGGLVDLDPDPEAEANAEQGGGAIVLGEVSTRGGIGAESGSPAEGAGGAGGAVTASARGGALSLTSVDSSGGDAQDAGGAAGTITLETKDLDGMNDDTITVASLTATGGTGTDGAGGEGGLLDLETVASDRVVGPDPESPLQEAAGGGVVTVGAMRAEGGNGTSGGDGGVLAIDQDGANDLTLGFAPSIRGGTGATAEGGDGGVVALRTQDGAIALPADAGSVSADVRGGTGATSGGDGGEIRLLAHDEDASGGSDITAVGLLDARGADAVAGSGGRGGAVEVSSAGGDLVIGTRDTGTPEEPNIEDVSAERGGGSITLADVDTSGGLGVERPESGEDLGDAGNGGAGGAVTVTARGGSIGIDTLTTTGGNGDGSGAGAGSVTLSTKDLDGANDDGITVASIRAAGGAGTNSTGGVGGTLEARTFASDRIEGDDPDLPLQEIAGGGSIQVGAIEASGGDGASGGSGGRVTFEQAGSDLVLAAGLAVPGGAGDTERGGRGGSITLTTPDSAIELLAGVDLDVAGGSGVTAGGNGGSITLTANDRDASGGSDITVVGLLTARGADASAGSGGSGGTVSVSTSGGQTQIGTRDIGTEEEPDVRDVFAEEGGGSITLADIDTSGGMGVARAESGEDPGDAGNGGAGGVVSFFGQTVNAVAIAARGGSISVGNVTTSGGSGEGAGGRAGGITLSTKDLDEANDDTITASSLVAVGGIGGTAAGGSGGAVDVRSFASTAVVADEPDAPHQEAAGGGAISIGAIRVDGAEGESGGNGGRVDLDSAGPNDLMLSSTVSGIGGLGVVSLGGRGGDVTVRTRDGAISDAANGDPDSVDVRGGDGEVQGGAGGEILLETNDGDASGGSDVDLIRNLLANGGSGATRHGGAGGNVGVRSFAGSEVIGSQIVGEGDEAMDEDVLAPRGGGAVRVAGIDAFGGTAGAPADGDEGVPGIGGVGGNVTLAAAGGAVDLSAVDASGGAGVARGGNGGRVQLFVANVNAPEGAGLLQITAAAVTATGGAASDGSAGRGGSALLQSFASARVEGDDPDLPLQESLGGGHIDLVAANLNGGDGSIDNGRAGGLSVFSERGDITLGAIEARPGTNAEGTSASHGILQVDAGTAEETPSGNLALDGDLTADDIGLRAADSIVIAAASRQIDARGGLSLESADLAAAGDLMLRADEVLEFSIDDASVTGDLTLATPLRIDFQVDGDQRVTAGGALRFDREGRSGIPTVATIAKSSGALDLEAGTEIVVPDGDKLAAAGPIRLTAPRVRVTDVTGTAIDIVSDDLEIAARLPAQVQLANGTLVGDESTDLIATTVSFSSTPEIVGTGPAPRIATASGLAANSGALQVLPIGSAVRANQIAPGGYGTQVLDLSIPIPDPGLETHEFDGTPIQVPQDLWISGEHQAKSPALSGAAVVGFLDCEKRGARRSCAPIASQGPASPLRSDRAAEVAERFRALLGGGERSVAGRRALAERAAERAASLVEASTRPYLVELAILLTQTRMLGLDPASYAEARDSVLDAVVGAVGTSRLDAERLRLAIEQVGEGLPL